jgi:hypothetical protein
MLSVLFGVILITDILLLVVIATHAINTSFKIIES